MTVEQVSRWARRMRAKWRETDIVDFGCWCFMASLYSFALSLALGIMFAVWCAPWSVKIVLIPIAVTAWGLFIFLNCMLAERVKEALT